MTEKEIIISQKTNVSVPPDESGGPTNNYTNQRIAVRVMNARTTQYHSVAKPERYSIFIRSFSNSERMLQSNEVISLQSIRKQNFKNSVPENCILGYRNP